VILGGLVAGVIINIFEFALHGFVLAKDMDAALRALRGGGGRRTFDVFGLGFSGGHLRGLAICRNPPALWSGGENGVLRRRGGLGPRVHELCAGCSGT
jgi:hypothetical protein